MAKTKLISFKILSMLSESKRLMEFLQMVGALELSNAEETELIKYKTDSGVKLYTSKAKKVKSAYEIIEENLEREKKKKLKTEIDYGEYRLIADKSEELLKISEDIISSCEKINDRKNEIKAEEEKIEFLIPWEKLDVLMGSKRTFSTNIFIGSFDKGYAAETLFNEIVSFDGELTDSEIEVVYSKKLLSCVFIMCHSSHCEKMRNALRFLGFNFLENLPMKTPLKAKEDSLKKIEELKTESEKLKGEIISCKNKLDELHLLADYYFSQAEKYEVVEKTGSTELTFYIKGFIPERLADEVAFEIEHKFNAYMEIGNEKKYINEKRKNTFSPLKINSEFFSIRKDDKYE